MLCQRSSKHTSICIHIYSIVTVALTEQNANAAFLVARCLECTHFAVINTRVLYYYSHESASYSHAAAFADTIDQLIAARTAGRRLERKSAGRPRSAAPRRAACCVHCENEKATRGSRYLLRAGNAPGKVFMCIALLLAHRTASAYASVGTY